MAYWIAAVKSGGNFSIAKEKKRNWQNCLVLRDRLKSARKKQKNEEKFCWIKNYVWNHTRSEKGRGGRNKTQEKWPGLGGTVIQAVTTVTARYQQNQNQEPLIRQDLRTKNCLIRSYSRIFQPWNTRERQKDREASKHTSIAVNPGHRGRKISKILKQMPTPWETEKLPPSG